MQNTIIVNRTSTGLLAIRHPIESKFHMILTGGETKAVFGKEFVEWFLRLDSSVFPIEVTITAEIVIKVLDEVELIKEYADLRP